MWAEAHVLDTEQDALILPQKKDANLPRNQWQVLRQINVVLRTDILIKIQINSICMAMLCIPYVPTQDSFFLEEKKSINCDSAAGTVA